MSSAEVGLTIWFVGTLAPFAVVITAGLWRLLYSEDGNLDKRSDRTKAPTEMLVPLKGVFPDQERILQSLVQQDHPSYQVVFILENESDEANAAVNRLMERHDHVRKVISGTNLSCAQKNHNLIAGLQRLQPETDSVVFCDSTNMADSRWLSRMTDPLDWGTYDVVTTFRAFHPQPETIGGLCQAHYASFLLVLASIFKKTWGGGTAIRRSILDRLHVAETWSRTVVDDLTLGNLLEEAGIEVYMDPGSTLSSPLKNWSVRACLDYLDRQILFPKYTNPGIWFSMTLVMTNLVASTSVALIAIALFALGLVGGLYGWLSIGFISVTVIYSILLKRINPFPISRVRWSVAFLPSMFLVSFVFLRSVFRNTIVWHGRIYRPGRGGVVLQTTVQGDDAQTGSV